MIQISDVPVTLTQEFADGTDDFLVVLTHDVIPGMRMVFNAVEWRSFMKWAAWEANHWGYVYVPYTERGGSDGVVGSGTVGLEHDTGVERVGDSGEVGTVGTEA